MKPPKSLVRRIGNEDQGAILVFFALALPMFLLVLGLVIDLSLVRLTGNRLQIVADSAALAGAAELPQDADVKSLALLYASKNYTQPGTAAVLNELDILTGHWDGSTFVPDSTPVDAVQVTTRRAAANNNPLLSVFGRFAGINDYEIVRSAVAHVGALQSCQAGGFFSESEVESGSDNAYLAEFCLYGKDGVKISSDNDFAPGAIIGMNDTDDFEQGGNNSGANDALTEMDEVLVLPALVPGIITTMETTIAGLPGFITSGPVALSEITDTTPLVSGTLYVVEDVADFGSDRTMSDIAVVAGKEIKFGSNNDVSNLVLATQDKILFGSNNQVGSPGSCANSTFNVYLFSESNIEFSSNNTIEGVQMSAGEELKLGSDISAMTNVYAEALGNIEYGSAEEMGACPSGLDSDFAEIVITSGNGNLVLVQ